MLLSRRWFALLVAVLLAGCQRTPAPSGGALSAHGSAAAAPTVVATIYPLAAIVKALVGDRARVVTLCPAAASPHTFELTPEAGRALGAARLVVRIGPGLDDWLSAMVGAGQAPVFTAMEHVTLLEGNPEAAEHPELKLDKDPHIWLDPRLVRDELAPALAAALAGVAGDKAVLDAALVQFQTELTQLDQDLAGQLSSVRQKRYLGAHPAWRYFNRRYGLEMVAAVEPPGGSEASAQYLRDVIATAKRTGCKVIFTETQLSDSLVKTVASETGAVVGVLDPMGGEQVEGRRSYVELMRYNAAELAARLR